MRTYKKKITNRQIEILKLSSEGLSDKQIGDSLFLAPKTIANHKQKLFRNLGTFNITHSVAIAIRQNII